MLPPPPRRWRQRVQDKHQHFVSTVFCIHTFNTTLTLTEIKKRHNLHCRRVLIQVMNQRTLSCATLGYVVCFSLFFCLFCFYRIWYVFMQSLYIITLFSVRFPTSVTINETLTLSLDGTRCFCQPFDFKPVSGFKKCWQLVLRNINFTRVHELQNCLKVTVRDVF